MFEDLAARVRVHVPFTALNVILREIGEGPGLLLDAGCGTGEAMAALKPYLRQKAVVGVDIFPPYIQRCRASGLHDEYAQADVRSLPFRDGSFDTVISVEVLEHLEKEDGIRFVAEMERVARRLVILTTPVGHFHLSAFDGNPHQEHVSQWSPAELRGLGYRVVPVGVRRLGEVIHSSSAIARTTRPLQYLLWAGAGPVVRILPGLAGDMVCIKRMG